MSTLVNTNINIKRGIQSEPEQSLNLKVHSICIADVIHIDRNILDVETYLYFDSYGNFKHCSFDFIDYF